MSPAPSLPTAPKKSEKQRQEEWHRGLVNAGKEAIENGAFEILTDKMVIALFEDGYKFPAEVHARFRNLIKKLEAGNPVPE